MSALGNADALGTGEGGSVAGIFVGLSVSAAVAGISVGEAKVGKLGTGVGEEGGEGTNKEHANSVGITNKTQ